MRCGFVAVVGRPNVGKSTLINALIGSKVSIVTAKPQTTRHRILGVYTTPIAQIIFVDTPGLHRQAGRAMNRLMNRTAANALADADVVVFVTEATRWTEEDSDVLRRLRAIKSPAEIDALWIATEADVRAFGELIANFEIGWTERDVGKFMRNMVLEFSEDCPPPLTLASSRRVCMADVPAFDDEVSLATIHLNSVEQLIVANAETRRLRASTSRAAQTQEAATNQRLAVVEAENRRLRRDLADAESKLEAITSIERDIRQQDP